MQEEGEVENELLAAGPHELNGSWVLYFDGALQSGKRGGANDWAKQMKRLACFKTVEDFWGVVNNIPPPSKLPVGSNYHLFREGILPMWEDMNNTAGGKWTFQEKRMQGMSFKGLDNMWLYTMLCLIGENFQDTEQICGGVCSLRQKQDRIAVWTRDSTNDALYNPIGETFRKALNETMAAGAGTKPVSERDLDYQPHDASLQKLGAGGGKRR
mmetsp:Transcript_18106/g.35345  ORF Transcript_18106/g.35345 Transcript_18106/m.35345 type:complete len:213 (+) Transcript_18106:16-654(+)